MSYLGLGYALNPAEFRNSSEDDLTGVRDHLEDGERSLSDAHALRSVLSQRPNGV